MPDVPPTLAPHEFLLSKLEFEDLYIGDDGTYEFVAHDGLTFSDCEDEDGQILDPQKEIHYLLYYLREKAAQRPEFRFDHDGILYRISLLPAQEQNWYVLRRAARGVPELKSFGGVQILQRQLLEAVQRPGLLIATGKTGSGKTNFLSATLKTALETFGGTGVSIEDPPELSLEGKYPNGRFFQTSFAEADFPIGVRRALRFRPKYIMVGEVRSQQAAQAVLQAAVTGHSVLTTVHGGSVPQCIMNLVAMAAPNGLTELAWQRLAETLQGVVYLHRVAEQVAPKAEMLLMPGATSEESIRSRIRSGHVESLREEMEGLVARARRGTIR